MEASSYLGRD